MPKQELIANILSVLPSMMRKLMEHVQCADMPKQQLVLLHAIARHDNLPMRFYSEHLAISKSNLTVLADKLIEAGFVERCLAADDRRVITLKVTEQGREYLAKNLKAILDNARQKFEKIDDAKLARLNELVMEMYEIVKELDNSLEEK